MHFMQTQASDCNEITYLKTTRALGNFPGKGSIGIQGVSQTNTVHIPRPVTLRANLYAVKFSTTDSVLGRCYCGLHRKSFNYSCFS